MGHLAAVEVTTWGGGGGKSIQGWGQLKTRLRPSPGPAPISEYPGARADVSSGASVASGVWPGLDISQLATSEGCGAVTSGTVT